METTQKETTNEFTELMNAIDSANMDTIDRMKIYNALARYIENDTKIINNITTNTWNADTKQ